MNSSELGPRESFRHRLTESASDFSRCDRWTPGYLSSNVTPIQTDDDPESA